MSQQGTRIEAGILVEWWDHELEHSWSGGASDRQPLQASAVEGLEWPLPVHHTGKILAIDRGHLLVEEDETQYLFSHPAWAFKILTPPKGKKKAS